MSNYEYKNYYKELGHFGEQERIRNKFIKCDDYEAVKKFTDTYDKVDIYTSVFSYDNATNRESIIKSVKVAPLYFDFDAEENLDKSKQDLSLLVSFFIQNGCPSNSLNIFFSGSKGFHLEVPFDVLGIEPSVNLPEKYKLFGDNLKKKFNLQTLDTQVYEYARLWRVVNTINSKSGLYKIPLSLLEIDLPISAIEQLAINPRDGFNFPKPDLWNGFVSMLTEITEVPNNGVLKPVSKGQRNSTMFARGIRLKAMGKSYDEALEYCKSIEDSPQLEEKEIVTALKSAYQEKYKVEKQEEKRAKNSKIGEDTKSFLVDEQVIYEEVYNPQTDKALFATFDGAKVSYSEGIATESCLITPIYDEAIKKSLVKLPSLALEYGNVNELIFSIRSFIHKYVDIGDEWEQWVAYYVLLTWVYDKTPICPYLGALGPSDTGKTRLISVVGAICYKSFTSSGSITASPIFRILDKFKGTLVLNEFDHIGEYNSEIITIMNNGFEQGFPVCRTEGDEKKTVQSFDVYGPKIFSARKRKRDWAFESRVITIPMKATHRKDIPVILPAQFKEEALELRNKLLMFRFRHYFEPVVLHEELFTDFSGRLKQTLLALTSVVNSPDFLAKIVEFGKSFQKELKDTRGFDTESLVYEALLSNWNNGVRYPLIKELQLQLSQTKELEHITYKGLGSIIRDELGFETQRRGKNGSYAVILTQENFDSLKERYGGFSDASSEPSEHSAKDESG